MQPTHARFMFILTLFMVVTLFGVSGGAEELRIPSEPKRMSGFPAFEDFNPEPNGFLVEMVRDLKPGRALDVAMGQGRNSIFLAQQGWDVTGFDCSEVGIKEALEAAKNAGVKITALPLCDNQFDFGKNRWDLVVLSYVPFRSMLERVRQSIAPGGYVMIEYFHVDTKKMRYVVDEQSFGDNELLQMFSDFRVLRYEDVMARQDWGVREGGEKNRLVRLWAQKKAPAQTVSCTMDGISYPEGGSLCWNKGKLVCESSGWVLKESCE